MVDVRSNRRDAKSEPLRAVLFVHAMRFGHIKPAIQAGTGAVSLVWACVNFVEDVLAEVEVADA